MSKNKPTFSHLVFSVESGKLWTVLAFDTDDAVKRVADAIDSDGDELTAVDNEPTEKPFEIVGFDRGVID